MSVRVRFAPSPTGHLHIGGARTALFNWLYARHEGGTFLLRIEDTDPERSTKAFEASILADFKWLGIDWDEGPDVGGPYGPYRQTERMDRYRAAADDLLARGLAYRCTCTPERLDQVRADLTAAGRNPGYDGHCRALGLGPDCGPHVVRLKVPAHGPIVVDDLVQGVVTFDAAEIDDLILVRTDGAPTYNFVVVCDDAAMGVTTVVRAAEHLNNTPKQLLLYEALGVTPPRFGHAPLILAVDGSKMSKRHGATAVSQYREMGFLPEAMLNYLVRLGWSYGDQELFTREELVASFTIEGINKSPSKWDIEKLQWVNGHWMRTLPVERIVRDVRPFVEERGGVVGGGNGEDPRLTTAVEAFRARARTLVELAEQIVPFFTPGARAVRDEEAMTTVLAPARASVAALRAVLAGPVDWAEAPLEEAVKAWCAESGLKLGKVAQPLRVALTGQKVGAGLFQTLVLLGRDSALARIDEALAAVETRGE